MAREALRAPRPTWRACLTARPDPVETAEWLVSHLLDDANDATDTDLFDYR
ncbi:hypothetical protein ACTMTU_04565 [Streptomyces sp. OZ13]|uniref:hypothetical protein n=1 Tax=Streptomyces sp. OZ13 TaxID=3452210 RepID=UPI003F8B0AB2